MEDESHGGTQEVPRRLRDGATRMTVEAQQASRP